LRRVCWPALKKVLFGVYMWWVFVDFNFWLLS
jgi:hypothetical protein